MAFALINSVTAGSVSGAAVTTGAIDTSLATILILAVGCYYPSGNEAISDSKSNVGWTLIARKDSSGADGQRSALYYCANPTVGSGHTFTNSAANFSSLAVYAFSGAAASPYDTNTSSELASPGNTFLNTTSISPAENNELVVSALCLRDLPTTGDTATVNNYGFSNANRIQFPGSGGNCLEVALAYLIQTTATAVAPDWGWTHTDVACNVNASFKAAGAVPAMGGRFHRIVTRPAAFRPGIAR